MRISADTGLAARPGDPDAIFETFMAGHLPPQAEVDTALPTGEAGEENKDENEDSLF
jgi:penicillin-binding protein 1A